MSKTSFALAAIAAFVFATSASAAVDFATIDVDDSGDLTYEEVTASLPDWTLEQFQALDLDGSNTLSQAEFAAAPMQDG